MYAGSLGDWQDSNRPFLMNLKGEQLSTVLLAGGYSLEGKQKVVGRCLLCLGVP